MDHLRQRARSVLASTAGVALAAASGAVAAVRSARKPLHPRGAVVAAQLRRHGTTPATGASWLDERSVDEVLVRRSRAIGLPALAPDVHGLALRVPLPGGGHGDVLFASTGLGRLSRFVLTASRSPYGRPMTTLLPYRTPQGPVLLSATATAENQFDLAVASPAGSWRPFATLVLSSTGGADRLVSFDPLRNELPGLRNYDWVRRLREPAYLVARRSRGEI